MAWKKNQSAWNWKKKEVAKKSAEYRKCPQCRRKGALTVFADEYPVSFECRWQDCRWAGTTQDRRKMKTG